MRHRLYVWIIYALFFCWTGLFLLNWYPTDVYVGSDWRKTGDMDGYIGFHAALRRSYNNFIQDLSKQCKEIVQHHLSSVTSPYSQVCYENDLVGDVGRFNQLSATSFVLDLSDAKDEMVADQENIPPKDQQHSTPGKATEAKDALRESQMTVPETPSPDQPQEVYGVKKDTVNLMDIGGRKRQARIITSGRNLEANRNQNTSILFGAGNKGSRTGSSYAEICSMSAQHFARIRQVLIERNIPSALSAGFLTPWWVFMPILLSYLMNIYFLFAFLSSSM